MRTAIVLAVLCGVLHFPAGAETPDEQQARILRIENAVLAPCCYTEPVARHQSEIAVKMRLQIAKWVAAGKSDQEILASYVLQYGSKVLVDPRTVPAWWTPWIPWLALVFGIVFAFWLLRRWRRAPPPLPLANADIPDLEDDE